MRLAARLAALALLAGCAIAPAAGASSSSHGDGDGKAGTGFSVDRSAASSLNLTSLLVAPAAAASSSPQIQYLGDTAGTSFAFSLRNTGVTSIGALQVARPTASWTIIDCPTAPAGWSVTRSDKTCRYRSAAGTADDLPAGQTWTTFAASATTLDSTLNGKGAWKLLVSSTESFSDPTTLASAPSEAPGLGVFTYSFELLDAGVVASAPAPGDPCPSLSKSATGGSSNIVIICGRNRTSAAATPIVPPSALAGSFLQGSGSFSSGSIAPGGPASASVVLGLWSGAQVAASTGSGKDLVVDLGSASSTTSPQTTVSGFTITAAGAPTASGFSSSTSEDTPKALGLSAVDPDGSDPLSFAIAVAGAHGALGVIGPVTCDHATPNTCTASVTYTPDPDYNGPDSLSYTANDGTSDSAPATASLTVNPVNDAPTASDGASTLVEDTPAPIDLGALVSDVETLDADLTYTIVSEPAHGQLSGSGSSPTYTPDPNFNGADSFTYKVTDRGDPDNCSGGLPACDASKASLTKTVSLTINPVNDAPVATDASVSTDEDTPKAVDLGALVSDLETSPANLAYQVVSPPAQGTLSGSGASRTYTPNPDFNGPDSFTYNVTDRGDPDNCGALGPACAAAKSSNTQTVSITINAVNDAPVNTVPAGPLSALQETDKPIGGLSVADVDAGSDDVQLTLSVSHGTVTVGTLVAGGVGALQVIGNGTGTVVITAPLAALNTTLANANGVVYHGSSGYSGPDTLNVGSDDLGHNGSGGARTDTDTVAITVVPPNNAPVAAAQLVSTNEDTAKQIAVSGTDVETCELTFSNGTGPGHGSLSTFTNHACVAGSPNADSADVTYTPDANYNGPDSFTFKVNDGTTESAPATVPITVSSVNDVPVAVADSYSTNEDTPKSVAAPGVLANDTDADNDTLHATLVGGPTHASSFTLNSDGSFDYTPTANYNGSDSFTYKANDGTADSNVATVTLTINSVNDAPVANNDSYSTNEDTPLSIASPGVLANDTDVDSSLSAVLVSGPAHAASFALNANGSFNYTPAANYNGPESFTYNANDGTADSNVATVSITVNAVNDAPALAGIEGTALGYTENDPATPITATTTVSDPDSADFSTGTLTVDWSVGGTVDDRLEIRNEGTGAGQIGVSGANVTFGGTTIGTFAGGSGTTPLVVTFNASSSPAAAQALVRNITYRNVSESPATAPRTVRFVLSDGDGGTSAPATRAVSVTSVNDAPVLAGIEGTAVSYVESVDSPPGTSQITNSLTISDVDSTNLTGATVQITTACQPAEDVLVFTNQNNISGSYVAATCTLTLSGSASLANYQTALRSVSYETTSDTPNTTMRVVTFQVDDGQAQNHASNTQTRNVTVTASNDSPVGAADHTAGFNGNIGISVPAGTDGLMNGVTDPEGDTLTAQVVTAPAGTLSITGATGAYTYDPPAGRRTNDPATYKVCDNGTPQRCTATKNLNLNVSTPLVWFVDNSKAA